VKQGIFMPLVKTNFLYGCVAISMGLNGSFAWAVESEVDKPIQLPTIKVEATRTDTAYMETPASIFRVDMPKNDQSLEVNLTEVVKGIPSVQLRNRENYAQDLQLSMRGFGAFHIWSSWNSFIYRWYSCHNARWTRANLKY
jgi:iron complex outermembrane receptor protein